MPNHWHLLHWPRGDGDLSEVLRWISVTPTQRWHAHHNTSGTGPVYQGRFKSFPVQTDEHFLTVARYVERNALRAKLVTLAEVWQWSSLRRRTSGDPKLTAWLNDWPVTRPREWVARVNRRENALDLDTLRLRVQQDRPFGEEGWVHRMAKRFGMESTLAAPRATEREMRKDSRPLFSTTPFLQPAVAIVSESTDAWVEREAELFTARICRLSGSWPIKMLRCRVRCEGSLPFR